jgi:hypothetical protein
MLNLPTIDEPCGIHFTYRDYLECSDSWKKFKVDNLPKSEGTYEAMRLMSERILDPVSEKFGRVILTYGFSSQELVKKVKKNSYPNINPSGDQHASCEVNRNGSPVCSRLGIAVDFYVAGVSSYEVACWVIEKTEFDRLYFYSKHRSFHVSVGPEVNKVVVFMDGYRGGRHQPKVMSPDKFLLLNS